jgi:hypothetical protein
MKKLILLFALCLVGFLSETTFAQVTFRVNIASQPIWGPVGYDHVEYYYLPDIEAYYYVPGKRYIYMENNHWISRSYLPPRYSHLDMYNSRKIVVNERKPYLHHQENRTKYASYNDRSDQQSIRDSHDSKYFVNRNHPEYSKSKGNKRNQGRNQNQNHGKRSH